MNAERRNKSWARDLWLVAMNEHGWLSRRISQVMFDWPAGKSSGYHANPPAFFSIADKQGTVDEKEYLRLHHGLIAKAKQRSSSGRAGNSASPPRASLSFTPLHVARGDVESAIQVVMATVHPAVVRHEQIMRCAFTAHLPEEMRNAIGTLSANLHPELPTPSKEYQRRGSRKIRARFDLGCGHPISFDEIVGVLELKALTAFNEMWFEKQVEKLNNTPQGMMFSGLAGDFQKLLDPKLPKAAFRFSWVVTKKRGDATPGQIEAWARSLLQAVERKLSLPSCQRADRGSNLGLCWRLPDGATLRLLWFRPKEECTDEFEPVWFQAT